MYCLGFPDYWTLYYGVTQPCYFTKLPQKTTVFILNYNFPSLIKSLIIYWTTIQQFELQFKWLSFSKHKEGQFSHWRQGNPYIQNEGVHLGGPASGETAPSDKQTKKIPPTALGWHHHDLPLRLSWEWLGWEPQGDWGSTRGIQWGVSDAQDIRNAPFWQTIQNSLQAGYVYIRQTLTASVNSTSQQDGQPSVTGRRLPPHPLRKITPQKDFRQLQFSARA